MLATGLVLACGVEPRSWVNHMVSAVGRLEAPKSGSWYSKTAWSVSSSARSARRVARICSFSVSSANSCGTWTGSGCLISSLRLLMMRLTTFLTSLNSIADKKHRGRSQMMSPESMMEVWKMILLCKRAAFRFHMFHSKKCGL